MTDIIVILMKLFLLLHYYYIFTYHILLYFKQTNLELHFTCDRKAENALIVKMFQLEIRFKKAKMIIENAMFVAVKTTFQK